MNRFFLHHFALLQLESYEVARYLRIAKSRYLPAMQLRQPPVWTAKLTAIAVILSTIILMAVGAGYAVYGLFGALAGAALSALALPLFLALATLAVMPLDFLMRGRIISAAKRKMAQFPKLIVIGIAGSYGKTTMKEAVSAVLKERYATLATAESVNTPLGISRLILEKLSDATEILIVEMGAHRQGDIAELCSIAAPDIAVVTGINEAHLERFKNLENTIAAKFEILDCAKEGACAVLNADDANIMRSYAPHAHKKKTVFYSASINNARADYAPEGEIRTAADGLERSFLIRGRKNAAYEAQTKLLGSYAIGTIAGAIAAAEHLGLEKDEVMRGIVMIRPVPHRLEPFMTPEGILVIDDSYNGNPRGARAAIETLASFAGRRKIYCTPGLVEMGRATKEIHEDLGSRLARVADLVILIETNAARHIADGLRKEKFDEGSVLRFKSARDAHESLPGILLPHDVILFQNDWPDNYF